MKRIIGLLRIINIRSRVALILILGLLMFYGVILSLSIIFSQKLVKDFLYNYVEVSQGEVISGTEMTLDKILMFVVRLLTQQEIYELFGNDSLFADEKRERIKNIIGEMLLNNEEIEDIVIITQQNEQYSYNPEFSRIQPVDKGFLEQVEKSSTPIWGQVKRDYFNNVYIPFGMKYNNFNTGQKIGYLVVYVRETALMDVYEQIAQEWGYSYITDSSRYISHPNKDIVGNTLLESDVFSTDKVFDFKVVPYNGSKSIYAVHQISERFKGIGTDWRFISVVSFDNLLDMIYRLNQYLIVLCSLMLICMMFASFYISMKITDPVRRLREKFYALESGDLEVFIEKSPHDEIHELERGFNDMVFEIRDLIKRINEGKEMQRELELTALQAQINPHFLYNTLDAIGWIARLNKQSDIELLVTALARFFRLCLHKGEKYITVEEEIQIVENYVTIELMRFPGKFEICYNIPDEIKSYKVLKIILQPIVENAIKHGFGKDRTKSRHIQVNGYQSDRTLKFEVIDNGQGFDIKEYEHAGESKKEKQGGYGLRNVDERIRLEYGLQYGLSIHSVIGKGTMVEIHVKTNE